MHYETYEDADLYLRHSIVKTKTGFIFVRTVDEDMMARGYDPLTHNSLVIPVEDLDLEPIKIGYAYDPQERKSYYFERTPSRSWRQGLNNDNCHAKGDGYGRFPGLASSLMKNLLSGRYPSLRKATRIAKKHKAEIPFSKVLSIDSNRIVRYKTQVIGEWDGKSFKLLSAFGYLKEMLEEFINEYTGA